MPSYVDWTRSISEIFYGMVSPLRDKILEKFKTVKQLDDVDDLSDIAENAYDACLHAFIRWVGAAKDVVRLYKWALPQEVIEKLQDIDIRESSNRDSERDNLPDWLIDDLVHATARSILWKVADKRKRYDKPHILFLSLANVSIEYQGHMMRNHQDFINYFQEKLVLYIRREAEKANCDPKLVADGLANLYGVIIDTSYVNWFPNTLPSQMLNGYNNSFAIFYNKSMSDEMSKKSKPMLFEGMIPDQRQLCF